MEEIIIKRIRNQLRIHWKWLKNEEDYNRVADFIEMWIRQATKINNTQSKD